MNNKLLNILNSNKFKYGEILEYKCGKYIAFVDSEVFAATNNSYWLEFDFSDFDHNEYHYDNCYGDIILYNKKFKTKENFDKIKYIEEMAIYLVCI